MQTLFKSVTKFILLSGLALLVFNCSKDDSNPLTNNQQVSSTEVKTVLQADDISGAIDDVIADVFSAGQSGKSSQSNDCHVTEFTDTGFTITFDSCSYDGGEMITGSISVIYTTGQANSYTASYTNLKVGEYEINGTRSFSFSGNSQTGISFTVTSDMTVKLEDGSIIEETGAKIFGFVFDFDNLENSGLTIDGNWTVKADSNTYLITITTPLEVTGDCDYVGKGIMQLNKNGLKVDIDFGDGTCDDVATLTYPDGATEEISLKD